MQKFREYIADYLDCLVRWLEGEFEFRQISRRDMARELRKAQSKIRQQQAIITQQQENWEFASENLARQLIRFLDDCEGAARGDLTVRADTTGDVLGTHAELINLLIENFAEIIRHLPPDSPLRKKYKVD